ncbi:peptidase, M48 family [Coleofasciculus chthonoplastes PCC 7420]|uniref:Peptidase, M48 family n=1 Tax=Coleofasciculus chthonoplastes PCC 7420 TaxID=118168 RepID=B4W3G1_9CYAN|nr:M48 family metallopeptidase [Coleofasciculus chthonoplastes]EDX71304.1 peptidase, M48 family [Coleofasciculus chthonoplastes PCC 7420]
MKLLWNSLLLSLGILLPTSTSIVLAESAKTPESIGSTQNLTISDSPIEPIVQTPDPLHHPMQIGLPEQVTVEHQLPTNRAEAIAIPETPSAASTSVIVAEDSSETPKTIVIPEAVPTSIPSTPSEEIPPEFTTQSPPSTVEDSTEVETIEIPETVSDDSADTEDDSETTAEDSTEVETIETPETASDDSADTEDDSETTAEDSTEVETIETPETASDDSADTEDDTETTAEIPELTPEERERQQKLIEADRLYMSGQFTAAQQLYREAKASFDTEAALEKPVAIYEPSELSPAGAVYWRQSEEGLEQELETKILVPLQFLVEQQPEFIPGHLRYAQTLQEYDRQEEAIQVLERATTLYPNEPDLIKAKVTALADTKRWLEASLAARQFAMLNFNHPQAAEFEVLAEENLERYRSRLRGELRGNAIANVITGALGYIFTGNLFGPISAIETTTLMLRGESAVGESFAGRVQKQLPMVEDEQVLEYVQEIGNKLAIVAGRDEFEYQFYVVMDDQLNAFALPGGKIFVNAGAILKTDSEAELAGLLAHELAHAVLSHGFQLVTEGNLIANVTQYIPFGRTATNLIVLDYSRDMERQADALGTKILVAGGYAADGLHNLMITLNEEDRDRPLFAWLSTHPNTEERISNIETLIERNGYNRYTYEGVARHLQIQERVAQLLKEYEAQQECEENDDEECEQKEDTLEE